MVQASCDNERYTLLVLLRRASMASLDRGAQGGAVHHAPHCPYDFLDSNTVWIFFFLGLSPGVPSLISRHIDTLHLVVLFHYIFCNPLTCFLRGALVQFVAAAWQHHYPIAAGLGYGCTRDSRSLLYFSSRAVV